MNLPSSWSARIVSPTTITNGTSSARRSRPADDSSLTITPTAPRRTASDTNPCPSSRLPRMATNTSPTSTRRLSIAKPSTLLSGCPATIRPSAATASCSAWSTSPLRFGTTGSSSDPQARPPGRQRLARDRAIFERHRPYPDLLITLVSLPRNDHQIASPRFLDRCRNRLGPVEQGHPRCRIPICCETSLDIPRDLLGILGAWVV